jgi:hypothetical protein
MKKLNFINAKNKLDRDEMKKIMAGSGGGCSHNCSTGFACCCGSFFAGCFTNPQNCISFCG